MQRTISTGTAVHEIRCTRCDEKGYVCTKTHAPPSRRYPRPSRSGKRIEQARILHGASLTEASNIKPLEERINSSTVLIRALTELRGAEVRINDRVMAGSLSIQLLNCFFAVCHMQAPVVDFAHFSKTFNAANGDPRKMSIMSNGGCADEGIPSMIPAVQGLDSITWPGTKESKIGTAGTTEALFAVLHAWAAHYTDAPIAFGSELKDLDAADGRLQEVDDNGVVQTSLDVRDAEGPKAGAKRPKRKQGVACDTCRLRRVRCDVTERPDGMGCSRCEDKRIKCTDTYIQTKRAKLMAKSSKANGGDGTSDAPDSSAEPLTPEANRLSPRSWISTRSEGLMRTYRRGDLEHNLRRGKARKAFCHALLNHALSLVHKYDILTKPSVEGVQVIALLAPLLDGVDGEQAHAFVDTACRHIENLGMSAKLVVDETNRHAVEHMLSTMQAHRIYLTIWTRDSMASAFNRRRPYLAEDRALEVVGQATFRKDAVSVASSPTGEVVLSGEMGLSFVIMTMVQIGALSRFLATHIDSAEGSKPSIPPWQRPAGASMTPTPRPARFAARPSLAELRKLERACGAVWNSLDSLMLFFDRCASKAWSTMNSLQPFRPLGWIASIKLCGSLLYLALFRALGERHRANAALMASLSHSLGTSSAVSEEDKLVAATLKALFDKSMQRAIVSCRKTARLFGILLPLGILQTGGPFLRQIFPVAQFLAKIPSVSEEELVSRANGQGTSAASSFDDGNFIDPQALLQQQHQQIVEEFAGQDSQRDSVQAARLAHALNDPTSSAHLEILHQLEDMHKLDLGPYTHSSKKKEVDNMIEALSQLGYAWDTMDREIGVIQDLMQSSAPAMAL
uniref:Zn(2)-C6 fungal-type domain-containing protein n=2 Tax=Kalmanozyma brasiliensis (strain GHG001) TaxID=1365824 RepID=V5GVK6_KALBG